jgi:hypothetical protein
MAFRQAGAAARLAHDFIGKIAQELAKPPTDG